MSKFDRNQIKDGWEKLCTNKQTHRQTDRQTNRHYEKNGHLAVNQKPCTWQTNETILCKPSQAHVLNHKIMKPAVASKVGKSVSELRFIHEVQIFFYQPQTICNASETHSETAYQHNTRM